MTHAKLVTLAAKWLRSRCAVVITEMASGAEIADAIGWNGENSTLIECKTSRADFRADFTKSFRSRGDLGMGNYRWYLAAPGIIRTEDLPELWGLLEPAGRGLRIIRHARFIASAGQTKHREVGLLISAIRRIGQNPPDGVSVKAYTYETKNTATLGVEVDDESEVASA